MLVADHPLASDQLKQKMKGVRMIAMNLMQCYFGNFYLFGELGDESKELDWLERTLRNMELNGEVGIIFAHHPPGQEDCIEPFSK